MFGNQQQRQVATVSIPMQTPLMLYGLIALNAIVFVVWRLLGNTEAGAELMAANFLVGTQQVSQGYVWTVITSAISHIDSTHLLFNMFALFVFGREIETVVGRLGFLKLYVVGGVLASLGHLLFMALSGSAAPALGASGSVMAIAVVYAVLFPKNKLLLFFILPIPAAVAVAGYVLLDVFGVLMPSDGVAHAAHLGGALYGLIYGFVWARPKMRRIIKDALEARRQQMLQEQLPFGLGPR